MKKIALVLLAIILCFSLCLTGCNKGDDATSGTEPSGSTTPAPQPLDKTAAVEAFNSFDLTKVMDNTGLSEEEVTKLTKELKFGMDGTVKAADDTMNVSVAVKDGYAYYKQTVDTRTNDIWVYFGDGTATMFYNNDGTWTKDGQTETEGDQSTLDAMYAKAEEILKLLKKPELKDSHLTEKDGLLYVSNDFILDAVKANAATLMGYEPEEAIPAEELNEFMEEVRESLAASGLEIAFAANDKAVTKLHIAIKVDEASELGKEVISDYFTTAASIDMDITDDGMTVKSLTFKQAHSFEKYEKGLKPESTITLNTVFNDKNEPVGFNLDVAATSAIQKWVYDEVNSWVYDEVNSADNDIYKIVLYNATAKGFVDSSKFTTAGAECANLTFKLEPTKAFKRTVSYTLTQISEHEYKHEKASDTSVAIELSDTNCYTASAELKITCESANKLVAAGSLNLTYGDDTMTCTATGNLYMNNVLNFPTSIPAEITSAVKAQ